MNAVPFGTLKMARKLEAAGFTGAQAVGTAEAMADAMSGAELATKSDLKGEIQSVKSELQAVKSELENKIDRLEVMFDAKIEILQLDMTIRLGAMPAGSTGVILAALRLVPR